MLVDTRREPVIGGRTATAIEQSPGRQDRLLSPVGFFFARFDIAVGPQMDTDPPLPRVLFLFGGPF